MKEDFICGAVDNEYETSNMQMLRYRSVEGPCLLVACIAISVLIY